MRQHSLWTAPTCINRHLKLLPNNPTYMRVKKYKSQGISFCIFQVISCILSTIELIFLNVKASYYPVEDIVGSSFCYFHAYTLSWFGMYTQFSSLFITFYRYICIFFGKKLVQLKISPKVIDWWNQRQKNLFHIISINNICTSIHIWIPT